MIFIVNKPMRIATRRYTGYAEKGWWIYAKLNDKHPTKVHFSIYNKELENTFNIKYFDFPKNLITNGTISRNYTKKQVDKFKKALIKEELKR